MNQDLYGTSIRTTEFALFPAPRVWYMKDQAADDRRLSANHWRPILFSQLRPAPELRLFFVKIKTVNCLVYYRYEQLLLIRWLLTPRTGRWGWGCRRSSCCRRRGTRGPVSCAGSGAGCSGGCTPSGAPWGASGMGGRILEVLIYAWKYQNIII